MIFIEHENNSEYELTYNVCAFIGIALLSEFCPSFSDVSKIIISSVLCTSESCLKMY